METIKNYLILFFILAICVGSFFSCAEMVSRGCEYNIVYKWWDCPGDK